MALEPLNNFQALIINTYTHSFQALCQNINSLLLVDKDNDWRINAFLKNANQLLPKDINQQTT